MDRMFLTSDVPRSDPEGLYAQNQEPFELEGTIFLPACSYSCGTIRANGDQLVQLCFAVETVIGNRLGTHFRMTPEGARELAGHLIAGAQRVDNHVAAQAAAAIEAARTIKP